MFPTQRFEPAAERLLHKHQAFCTGVSAPLRLALAAGASLALPLTDWLVRHVSSAIPSPLFTAVARAAGVWRPSRVDIPS